MNKFLFFRYGNRMLIFFYYYYLVREFKYWKQSINMANVVPLSANQIRVSDKKENYYHLLWRKCSLKLDLKKSEFLKGFFNLFVFGFLFTIIKITFFKTIKWSFMVKKMFIEIRLRNLMTYVFKGHVKIAKIYMVKFIVSILNRLKIISFLWIQSKYMIMMSFSINCNQTCHYFGEKIFPHLNPTNYLKIYFSVIRVLKSKEKKLALTLFCCLGQITWLDDSWKLIHTNQSRFYNFFHVEN